MAKSVGNVTHAGRRARRLRAGRADRLHAGRALPAAARVLGGAHGGGAPVGAPAGRLRPPVRRSGDLAGGAPTRRSRAARRVLRRAARRLQHARGAGRALQAGQRGQPAAGGRRPLPGAAAALEEMLDVLGLERMLEGQTRSTRTRCASSRSARMPACRATSRGRTRVRDELLRARAGRCATPPRARSSCRSPAVDPLWAQRRAGGAAGQAAGAPRLGGGRARWPRRSRAAGSAARVRRRRRARGRFAARRPIRALVARGGSIPVRRPGDLLKGDEPLVVALDQIQDPQNLGAICRSAEGAGASGVVIPERRAAEVTPAVCRASAGRRRAPRDRAGAQPRRLPRGGQGRAPGSTARTPRPPASTPTSMDRPGRRGTRIRGPRAASAGAGGLRRPGPIAPARKRGIAECLRRCCGSAVRGCAISCSGGRRDLTSPHNTVHLPRKSKVGLEVEL